MHGLEITMLWPSALALTDVRSERIGSRGQGDEE